MRSCWARHSRGGRCAPRPRRSTGAHGAPSVPPPAITAGGELPEPPRGADGSAAPRQRAGRARPIQLARSGRRPAPRHRGVPARARAAAAAPPRAATGTPRARRVERARARSYALARRRAAPRSRRPSARRPRARRRGRARAARRARRASRRSVVTTGRPAQKQSSSRVRKAKRLSSVVEVRRDADVGLEQVRAALARTAPSPR